VGSAQGSMARRMKRWRRFSAGIVAPQFYCRRLQPRREPMSRTIRGAVWRSEVGVARCHHLPILLRGLRKWRTEAHAAQQVGLQKPYFWEPSPKKVELSAPLVRHCWRVALQCGSRAAPAVAASARHTSAAGLDLVLVGRPSLSANRTYRTEC
jgi:hypothetical protein